MIHLVSFHPIDTSIIRGLGLILIVIVGGWCFVAAVVATL